MSQSMRNALKILNAVADLGFDKTKPEDREKRSSLIQGLMMTKYDRAKHNAQREKEVLNVQKETI